MTVREASADDVEGIRDVARASWETDYPEILSRETVEAGVEEWYATDRIREAVSNPRDRLFVAEEGGDLVGFAHATLTGEQEGYLLRLYVAPDARRRGVGRELLERVRENLFDYGVDRVYATVLSENDLGNAFYRDFGFQKVDEGETTIGGDSFREDTLVLRQG
jgi:ribosomal protein S18 acetylase RimI-like enzyme